MYRITLFLVLISKFTYGQELVNLNVYANENDSIELAWTLHATKFFILSDSVSFTPNSKDIFVCTELLDQATETTRLKYYNLLVSNLEVNTFDVKFFWNNDLYCDEYTQGIGTDLNFSISTPLDDTLKLVSSIVDLLPKEEKLVYQNYSSSVLKILPEFTLVKSFELVSFQGQNQVLINQNNNLFLPNVVTGFYLLKAELNQKFYYQKLFIMK